MDLSVLVCTWNNAKRLRITLEAITQCTIPQEVQWELVLVNNNCVDSTDDVVAEFTGRLPIKYVHEPTPGLSHARNAGLRVATGRLIIFTDDDVSPYPSWLVSYWHAFTLDGTGFYFGGPLESEFEQTPVDSEILRKAPLSVKGLDYGPNKLVRRDLIFIGPNWACPRKGLEEVGGFNSSLGLVGGRKKISVGEESDIMRRLRDIGWMPCYLPDARLRHFVPADKVSLRHIAGRREAFGYYRSSVLARHRTLPGPHICGVPISLLSRCARSYLYWVRLRVRRVDAELPYVYWRESWGEVTGAFEVWRRHRVGG